MDWATKSLSKNPSPCFAGGLHCIEKFFHSDSMTCGGTMGSSGEARIRWGKVGLRVKFPGLSRDSRSDSSCEKERGCEIEESGNPEVERNF